LDPAVFETITANEQATKIANLKIPTLSANYPTKTPEPPMEWDVYTSQMADLTNSCLETNKEIFPIFSDLGENPRLLQEEDFLAKYNAVLDDYYEFCANLYVDNPPIEWEQVNEYYATSDEEFQAFVDLLRKVPESNNVADIENAFEHHTRGNEYLVLANIEMEKVLNK
jgi:hypothetical protein